MRQIHLKTTVLTSCLLLVAGTSAFGQWSRFGSPQPDRQLFDQARSDLDRASRYTYASRSDIKRFDEARSHLFGFESRFDQGRYDKHQLDEAVSHIQSVVDRNSLDPRDRGALSDDLRRMRDFRAYREHGGPY